MFRSKEENDWIREEETGLFLTYEKRQKALEGFTAYLYEKEHADNTISKYRTDIRTFYRFLGESKTVTKKLLVGYKKWLEENYAPASANSMIAALNLFLKFLGAEQLKIRPFRIQKQAFSGGEKKLTKEEYGRLLEAAAGQGKEQLAILMETIGGTGARVSELKFFTVESVRKGKVEVNNKGKRRVILIPRRLWMKLTAYLKKQGIRQGEIFLTREGNPKNRSNIWREMKRLAERSGVDPEKIFPHNLRHFFAVNFYRITRNLVKLADILGHSSIEVTRGYARSGMEECERDMDLLYEQTTGRQHKDSYVALSR